MKTAFKSTDPNCPSYDVPSFSPICDYPPIPVSKPMSVTSTTPIMPPIVMPDDFECTCLSFANDDTRTTRWGSGPNSVKISQTSDDCCSGEYDISADISVPCPLGNITPVVRTLDQRQTPSFLGRTDSSSCESTLTIGMPCVPSLSSNLKFVGKNDTSVTGDVSIVSGNCSNILTGTITIDTPALRLKGIGCHESGSDEWVKVDKDLALQSADDSNVKICVDSGAVTFGVYYV